MSAPWLLWIVTALYAGQAVQSAWAGQHPQALLVAGYVIANLGLIWSLGR